MFITSRLARHVCILLGYLYPALASAKAAVQQDTAGYTQWMTYWVVMSVFALGELLVDFFVSWVPFYFEAKIVLIVWLTLPRYQGASQIYQRFLHPYLEHYEGDIDSSLEGMRVEATRRIQSLGASAANEIAKAVTRQGFSAKEQILARMLGMAAGVETSTDAVGSRHDFMYEAEDVQQPGRRDKGGRMGNDMEAKEEEEDVAAVKASMLHDFKEIMKGGVFVEARSSLTGEDSYNPWSHGEIRLVKDRVFSMVLDSEGKEKRFEVCSVVPSTTDRSLLLLRTDQGRVDLSLPGDEDRDSILAGFELLLASNEFDDQPVPAASGGKADELLNRSTMTVERGKSRQWDTVPGQGSGMVMESGDEEEETEEDDDSTSPKAMSPLSRSRIGTE